jgi:hypothetical protein
MRTTPKSEVRRQKWKQGALLFLTSTFCLLPCGSIYGSGEPDAFALTGVGARAGGMGNASIGLSDEIETIYYNPAGLGNLVQSGATAMYQAPSIDTSRGFLGLNQRWSNPKFPGSIGFGWLRLRSSDIELTSADERILGTDTLTDDMFILAAGVHPWAHWSTGLSVKYVRFAFDGFSEGGAGYDFGVHAQYNPLRFGFSFTDIGGTVLKGSSFQPGAPDASDKIPARWRPGVGLTFHEPFNWPVYVALDVDALVKLQGAQDTKIYTGAEIWGFQNHGAFRTGYQEGVGPTLGFGARIGLFQIDYAFLYSLHLKDEHRISTTIRL